MGDVNKISFQTAFAERQAGSACVKGPLRYTGGQCLSGTSADRDPYSGFHSDEK